MKYLIKGKNLPIVLVTKDPEESVFTESGEMSWMTDCIKMKINTKGGLVLASMLTNKGKKSKIKAKFKELKNARFCG